MISRFILSVALLACAVSGIAASRVAAQTTSQRGADSPAIVTTGTGEANLPPTRAAIGVEIESRAPNAARASAANAEKMRKVVDTIRALGFPRDSIRTMSFGVQPNYDYQNGQRLVDYGATALIRVPTRDLARVGAVIDAALAGGATAIRFIDYQSDSLEAGRQSAMAKALRSARSDAEALARAAGGRLGRLIEVTTAPSGPIPIMARAEAMQMDAANVNLTPRDVVVNVGVQATWEFVSSAR